MSEKNEQDATKRTEHDASKRTPQVIYARNLQDTCERASQNTDSEEFDKKNTKEISKRHQLNSMQRKLLNFYFDTVIKNVSIDYSNEEFVDLESALSEWTERIKERINCQGIFRISRIELRGSMAEKSSIWKWTYGLCLYVEFDYLAVLKHKTVADFTCKGCQSETSEMLQLRENYGKVRAIPPESFKNCDIGDLFNKELLRCLTSEFDCLYADNINENKPLEGRYLNQKIHHRHSSQSTGTICDSCCLDRPTGKLRICISEDNKKSLLDWPSCSLMFSWKSIEKKLCVPVDHLCQSSTPISTVFVAVDILPAIKTTTKLAEKDPENTHYLVPKDCNECTGYGQRMRRSYCNLEIDKIKTISEKHLRCYRIVKYVAGLMNTKFKLLDNYHMKTIVLQHCRNCSDDSSDLAECVLEIFQYSMDAYDKEQLPATVSGNNLLIKCGMPKTTAGHCRRISSKLLSVSDASELMKDLDCIAGENACPVS